MTSADSPRPSGVVTFLFTDVQGSTQLWANDTGGMGASLQVHDSIMRNAVAENDGYLFGTAGDSFAVAFHRASDAITMAQTVQAELAECAWPGPALKVRMGLHMGEAEERDGDYFGPVVNLAARVEAAGHGGQILITDQVRFAISVPSSDLGIHRLKDVTDPIQLWQVGAGEFPHLRVVSDATSNLPAASSPIIGRDAELVEIAELLNTVRAVTVRALGGMGKTRLALEVGAAQQAVRENGVWFVDLSSVAEAGEIAPTIAAALRLTPATTDATTQVLNYLAQKDVLLILDNCEHVIESAAEFVEAFLARPGKSVVFSTSREQLDIDGENVVVLAPLGAEGAQSAAVELFTQRARSINSAFDLAGNDASIVAELCARLDGLPLAIELAAARSSVMSPVELLAGLEDRFALLATGRRRKRTRTLEATLDWSYHLLENDERSLLCALSAFRGDFGLEAAIDVAGVSRAAGIELIESLIAKSLVARETADGQSRYRLLETTVAYATERLAVSDDREAVFRRHVDHYVELGSQYPVSMWSDLAAADELRADKANIVLAVERAALFGDWAAASNLLASAFAVFYEYPQEGLELVDKCLANLDDNTLGTRLMANSWWLRYLISDFAGSIVVTSTLRDCDDPIGQVFGRLMHSVQVASLKGNPGANSVEQAREILASLRPSPDKTLGLAVCEMVSALRALYQHDPERACLHADRSFEHDDQVGFTTEVSGSIVVTKAIAELMLGRPEDALVTAQGGTIGMHSTGLEVLALANTYLGNTQIASDLCRKHAQRSIGGRVRMRATDTLLMLAVLSAREGDEDHARELLLTMGFPRHSQLAVYAEHVAASLGIGDEFASVRESIFENFGVGMRERAISDLAILRDEMTSRGWF